MDEMKLMSEIVGRKLSLMSKGEWAINEFGSIPKMPKHLFVNICGKCHEFGCKTISHCPHHTILFDRLHALGVFLVGDIFKFEIYS